MAKDKAVNDVYLVLVRGKGVRRNIARLSRKGADGQRQQMKARYPKARIKVVAVRCSDAMRVTVAG